MNELTFLKAFILIILVFLNFEVVFSLDYAKDYLDVPSEYPTIQAGIDAARGGDIVLVAKGTFMGTGNKDISLLGKAITVKSISGPDHSVIDGENVGRIFHLKDYERADTIIDGFTITNGDAKGEFINRGGGIFFDRSSPTVKNCIVTENTALSAGGIYIKYSNPYIINCVISDNSGGRGAGIYCNDSSPEICSCQILHNDEDGIAVLFGSHVSILNCIISGNCSQRGGGIYCGSESYLSITNCTIVQNICEEGGGIYLYYPEEATIVNSIIWDNQPNEIVANYSSDDIFSVSYSDIKGGWFGDGNIDTNPLFTDPGGNDFHLQLGSPCLDAGIESEINIDIDGDLRPMNGNWDMGADEVRRTGVVFYVTPQFFNLSSSVGGQLGTEGMTVVNVGSEELLFSVYPGSESWISLSGELSGRLAAQDSAETKLNFDISDLGVGTFFDTLLILSNDPFRNVFAVPVKLDLFSSGMIYVPDDFETIQEAIDFSLNGAEVIISDGSYTGEGNKELDYFGKAITLRSVNGPEATIIDCESDGRGFWFENGEGPLSRLEGLSITNGDDTGIFCTSLSSPSISNCILRNNHTDNYGGGICLWWSGNPYVSCCEIYDNSARGGGGIYTGSEGLFENCIVSNNSSLHEGGGIRVYSSDSKVEIINCVITDNITSDWEGGGIAVYFSGVDVVNSIVRDNTPDQIAEGYGVLTVRYSNIEGGWSGVGNIDQDPLFYEYPILGLKFLLEPSSPCIDTGDPSIEDSIYDWHPRWPDWYPNGAQSDMGVYGGPGNRGWIKWLD